MSSFLLPLLNVVVVLAVFAGAMVALKRFSGRSRGTRAGAVQVLATAAVGRGAQVAVVRIGGTTLALGVTEGSVSNLGEVDLPAEESDAALEATGIGTGTAGPTAAAGAGFWARFEAAAKAQGPAPRTLVAGAVYLVKAVRRMRGTAADLNAPTDERGPDAQAFDAAFARACADTQVSMPKGDPAELERQMKTSLMVQQRAELALSAPKTVTFLPPGGMA